MTSDVENTAMTPEGGKRRDFLSLLAGAMTAVGAGCVIWPFIDSMEPAADTLAAGAPIEVDLKAVRPGQQILVRWRSRPVFIVNRTQAQLARLQQASDTSLLSDPNSSVEQQPPYARNWHRSLKPEFLLLVGICTHLGCIPGFRPDPGGDLGAAWPGGYFCPCHGSRYDLSGRVFKGVPAPYNLPVPPYRFISDTVVRIGENPPGTVFDFGSIAQI